MTRTGENAMSWALLVLRIGASALLVYGHGWPKLIHFSERVHHFANPIGLGSAPSFVLVVFAEVVCASLVALGLFTRPATIPLVVFFAVAAFVQHAADPFGKKELALLFAIPYVAVLIAGPGRFSLDALIRRR